MNAMPPLSAPPGSATPRTRKKRGQGPSRRAEILASAKRLFVEQGLQHATMRKIASDVGVSSTALYVYFPDKMAILQAIAEAMFEALLVAYAESQRPERPPLERFRAGLMAYVALGLERPDEYRLTFDAKAAGKCDEVEAAGQSFGLLRQNVAAMMRLGLFARGDDLLAAEVLWASMHGLVMLLINVPHHVESEHGRLIDAMLDAAIRGLRPV